MNTSPDQTRNIEPNRKRSKAVNFSLIAGVLILCNSALVGASAKWLPGLLPTLPGSAGNDPTVLYTLTAAGLTFGALVLVGAIMLYLKPAKGKIWGIFIVGFSVPSVICGGGFIVGFIMGILGGRAALSTESDTSSDKLN
jgi:hypothetical protein